MCAVAPLSTSHSSRVNVVGPAKWEECSSTVQRKTVPMAECAESDFGVGSSSVEEKLGHFLLSFTDSSAECDLCNHKNNKWAPCRSCHCTSTLLYFWHEEVSLEVQVLFFLVVLSWSMPTNMFISGALGKREFCHKRVENGSASLVSRQCTNSASIDLLPKETSVTLNVYSIEDLVWTYLE